ncbi:hypothetical protein HMPREF2736_06595 [Corynebacterium sp. HMSC036E10]|nr:hypothetical protein HMPREF2736_06595 [Corynebacterium sp. HMSC036E10]
MYSVTEYFDPALGKFREGNRLYKLGEYEAAVPFLSAAVAAGSSDVEAPRRLAISYVETEELDLAQRTLNTAMGDSRYSESDRNLLRSMLEKVQTSTLNATGPVPKGDLKKRQGAPLKPWQNVEAMQREYADKSSKSSWVYKFANALQNIGRLDEAAEQFAIAFKGSGESSWYAYRAGLAYELSGDKKAAEVYYALAIQYDKKFRAEDYGIGPFHVEKNFWDLAAEAYAKEFEDSRNGSLRYELALRAARSYAQMLDVENAAKFYQHALNLQPFESAVLREYCNLLEIAGKFEEASNLAEIGRTLSKSGNAHDRATWVLARLFAKQGKTEKAARLYMQIISPEPDDGDQARSHESDSKPELTCGAKNYIQNAVESYEPTTVNQALGAFDFADEAGAYEAGERILNLLNLKSEFVEIGVLQRLAKNLLDEGRFDEICALALQTKENHPPRLHRQKLPPAGSHSERLMKYAEWCELPLRENVVFYESNLGLSIDCNPYAIYRGLRESKDRTLFHVWAVDGDVSIPLDVQEDPNTVVIEKSSLVYTKLLATAKYIVNNSTFPTYFIRREGQKYLMTWHGTPLKTLCKDQREAMTHGNMARNYLQASHAIFPNEHTRRVMIEQADIGEIVGANIKITGYPRNDGLVRSAGPTGNTKPVALFAPTWRVTDSMEAQAEHLVRVGERLRAAGFQTLLRAHHYVEKIARELDSQLEFVDRSVSTYDLLPEVDLLVTDFSSIYFDFAVTKRPIVFFVPDWEEYVDERGVYFEKSHLPGIVCENYDELVKALARYPELPLANEEFLQEFSPKEDGDATQRAIDLLFAQGEELPDGGARTQSPTVLFRQSFIPNGMASSFVNLSKQLVAEGIGVSVLTPGDALRSDENRQQTLRALPPEVKVIGRVGPIIKDAVEYHYSIVEKNRTKPRTALAITTHRKLFRREQRRLMPDASFDCYIEFDGYSEFMANVMLGLANERARTGIYLHNDIVAEAKTRMPELYRVIESVNEFDRVVSVSERLMQLNSDEFLSECGVHIESPAYVENSIVGDEIVKKSLEEMEVELPTEFSGRYYVHVGRFSPEKNHDFLLELFSELLQEDPTAKLLLVGDGPERYRIEHRVSELGLSSSVFFVGLVENPYPYIANSRGLLLPSRHEGQPMVILEASSLGIPVFASEIDAVIGMRHLVDMNVLPFDKGAWVEALLNPVSHQRRRFDYHAYENRAVQQFKNVFLTE